MAHAGGRPPRKIKNTWESIKEFITGENREVILNKRIFSNDDFNKEKDLVRYITDNIVLFGKEYLNDEIISFEVDKPLYRQAFGPRGKRVDIFIKGKKSIYIIECKNAENTTEIRYSIGQLLDYGREYLDPKKELLLIANMYDESTAKTISYYNLPIRYIIFSKNNSLEYVREA